MGFFSPFTHEHFIPDPFQFATHWLSNHSILYSPRYCQHHHLNDNHTREVCYLNRDKWNLWILTYIKSLFQHMTVYGWVEAVNIQCVATGVICCTADSDILKKDSQNWELQRRGVISLYAATQPWVVCRFYTWVCCPDGHPGQTISATRMNMWNFCTQILHFLLKSPGVLNDIWDHYAWRKNRKHVKGRLLLGTMNIKLFNKNSWHSVETQNGYLQNSQASCYSVNLPGQNMVEPWCNTSHFKIFSHSRLIFCDPAKMP